MSEGIFVVIDSEQFFDRQFIVSLLAGLLHFIVALDDDEIALTKFFSSTNFKFKLLLQISKSISGKTKFQELGFSHNVVKTGKFSKHVSTSWRRFFADSHLKSG